MKTVEGGNGTYIFVKMGREYHVFVEVETKQAAEDCGAERRPRRTARQMCDEVWNRTA